MSDRYRKCTVCGDLFPGAGGICPVCARAMEREPVEVMWKPQEREPKKEPKKESEAK